MKTYIFNAINRYKRFSENLEVQSAICNKSWWVFNDSGEKELYIFQEDGTLYITLNGKVTNGTWKYISANKSLIIGTADQSYMVHAAFIDATLLTLQVDGTEECAFLVNETNKQTYLPQTYSDIMGYFLIKEQMCIKEEEERKQRQLEEEKARLEAEERRKEEERLRAIEEAEKFKLWEEEQKRSEAERIKQDEIKRIFLQKIEIKETELSNLLNEDTSYQTNRKITLLSLLVSVVLFFLLPSAIDSRSDILWIVVMFLFLFISITIYSGYNWMKKGNDLMNNWVTNQKENSDLAINEVLEKYIEFRMSRRNLNFSLVLLPISFIGWIIILYFVRNFIVARNGYIDAKNNIIIR